MKHFYAKTCAALCLMWPCVAGAVPARPLYHTVKQADGTLTEVMPVGDENYHYFVNRNGQCVALHEGMWKVTAKPQRSPRHAPANPDLGLEAGFGLMPGYSYPSTGSPKALVLLVEFADQEMITTDAYEYFNALLNQEGFAREGGTGSVKDYYTEISGGRFTPDFDLYGPIKLPESYKYYGGNNAYGNDKQPYRMLIDACDMLDDTVDFSQYDTDGDGKIDNIFVFYAGRGEASGGGPDTIWPHSGNVGMQSGAEHYYDGKQLNRYACANEWGESPAGQLRPDGIGTFVHEFCHVLGLPDLYTTHYTHAFTPGSWSVMDMGPYNNDSRTPPRMSAYELLSLGWIDIKDVNRDMNVMLPEISKGVAARIPTYKSTEFFLLENRQQHGWDAYIPGHGMLVWHIDFVSTVWSQNIVNDDNAHQYVDIEEADNYLSDENRSGDSFPGALGITSFTDETIPSMKTWNGKPVGCPLTDICEEGGVITFTVAGGSRTVPASEVLVPENCSADGFTARWTVTPAASHLLSVYSKTRAGAKEYVPGFSSADMGDADHADISGLTPGTTYYYTIANATGLELSAPSVEAMAYTGEAPMEHYTVGGLKVANPTHEGFDMEWEPLFGATGYLVSVNKILSKGDSFAEALDFTGGINGLPKGWEAYKCSDNKLSPYVGAEAPSLKIPADGYLQTPDYEGFVANIRFWQRATGTPEDAFVRVEGLVDGTWKELAAAPVVTKTGGETTTLELEPVAHTVRIVLESSTGKGSVSIDDLALSGTGEMELEQVAHYTQKSIGAEPMHTVTGLDQESDYLVHVQATDGEYVSLPSQRLEVRTLTDTGVDAVEASGLYSISSSVLTVTAPTEVYDITGRKLASLPAGGSLALPAHGIYLLKSGTTSFKIAF